MRVEINGQDLKMDCKEVRGPGRGQVGHSVRSDPGQRGRTQGLELGTSTGLSRLLGQ